MKEKEKNLSLERLVFFCDAVVAIAITLLALDLRIEKKGEHLHFSDIFEEWRKFAAFILSFIIIAVFWKVHHEFFVRIKKIDARMITYNLGWLLFIVLLPFSTTLVSSYITDKPAIMIYSINVLMITVFQNNIWDHAAVRKEYLYEETGDETIRDFRIKCNIAMVNALLAIGICFFSPIAAFITLFTRLPMITLGSPFFKRRRLRS
jgi:TMEM175 potassium channel family protein